MQACDRGEYAVARTHFLEAFELCGRSGPAILSTKMLLLLGQPSAAVEEYQRLLDAALEHPYFLSDADKSAVEQRLQEASAPLRARPDRDAAS